MAPLFEVQMELSEGRAQFQPSLEVEGGDSFLVLVEGLLGDMEAVATSMPRLLEGAVSYKVSPSQAAAPSPAGVAEGGRVPSPSLSSACPFRLRWRSRRSS